ncbi:MAG: DegT/DnrJ/EryC1/StrS family aminotransferase [Vicinamibacterales bacterium]|jgi:dTDP-4-amino-4,6-dideoxygalactose transaminase|nr:DegT/DnrJ/EryC1/StrS family aminotransferase [Vicinamibacterales bacterium]
MPNKRERVTIPFLTLKPGEEAEAIDAAIRRVVTRGWFVLGPEVESFEREFATASGIAHTVGVGNGTDALFLLLKALGIGPGDEVITTPLSAAFSALAIVMAGARPVFADIDVNRLTIDPAAVRAAVGPKTAAILPVHLYGQPADMPALADVASRHHLALIEDCCQAHLATCAGRPVGTFGQGGAFSFYPTKNLGAVGDGGVACTGDEQTAERIRKLRNGGQSAQYRHDLAGVNSRLDDIQAAVLRAKLPFLERWTARRRALAALYREHLAVVEPTVPAEHDPGHVYHLFPVRSVARDRLRQHLRTSGIDTLIHYPTPLTQQPAFAEHRPAAAPVAEAICRELVSLPLHPALTDASANQVIDAVRAFAP